jgi:hypothetical protein
MNFFITILNTNITTNTSVIVGSSGTFTYTLPSDSNIQLSNISLSVADTINYGNSYIKSNLVTINTVAGPVNANLTTSSYTLMGIQASFNINISVWNQSYPLSMYVYLASSLGGTVVYSFGSKNLSVKNNAYSISFNATIPLGGVTQGTY